MSERISPDMDIPLIWQRRLAFLNCSSVTNALSSNSNLSFTRSPRLVVDFYDFHLSIILLKLSSLKQQENLMLFKNIRSQIFSFDHTVSYSFDFNRPFYRHFTHKPRINRLRRYFKRSCNVGFVTKILNKLFHVRYYKQKWLLANNN